MPTSLSIRRPEPWKRPGTFAILCALSLSVVVHGATFFGVSLPAAFPPLWGLHVVAIIAFGAMMLTSRRTQRVEGFALPKWPVWAYLLVIAAFLYAFINFAICFGLIHGTPEVRDGLYVLSDHGRIIRELSADEYRWQQAYIARGFSGHWMFFLVLPSLYFTFRDPSSSAPTRFAPAV